MAQWWRLLAALASGAMFPFAFAPFDWPLLSVASLALLLWCWQQQSAKQALKIGFIWGIAAFGIGASWVHVAINVFGGAPLWLSLFLTAGFVALLSCYPALLGFVLQKYFADRFAKWLAFIALWTLSEFLRGHLFSGFPWLFAGYAHTDSVLATLAPLGGVYLISLVVAALSVVMFVALSRLRNAQSLSVKFATSAMLFTALGLTLMPISLVTPVEQRNELNEPQISVALIQSNVQQQLKWQPEQLENIKALYQEMSVPLLGKTDLIIWPEGAIPSLANYLNEYIDDFHRNASTAQTGILMTMPIMEPDRSYYNSVFGVGNARGRYDKRHLVPFGEYVPFEGLLRGLLTFFDLPMSGFSEGKEGRVIETPKALIASAICYEIAYPELVRENVMPLRQQNGFLLTVSNDAWFGRSIGPAQHMQIARMRAIENGVPLVRTTVTGITGVTNAFGQMKSMLPSYEQGILKTTVTTAHSTTAWQRFGLWPVALLCVLLLGVAIGLKHLKTTTKTPQ